MSNWQKNISKNYYTQLINTPSETIFEFNRTKIFFEKLLDRKIDIKKPIISLNKDTDLNLPKKYLTLFIGATTPFRCWPIENYVKVIEYILVNFQDLDILICGGVGELAESKKLTKIFQNERVRNYVGVTTLVGLIEIISKSRMLLSNESNAPHIAMAFDVHTIVLYNGFNFRRFASYPKYMTNKYFLICHPKISNNFREYEIISNKRGYDRVLSMDDITVDEVVGQIENLDFILNKER
jgi:ADP-heptose:LPS heptosyltransferase